MREILRKVTNIAVSERLRILRERISNKCSECCAVRIMFEVKNENNLPSCRYEDNGECEYIADIRPPIIWLTGRTDREVETEFSST